MLALGIMAAISVPDSLEVMSLKGLFQKQGSQVGAGPLFS